MEVLAEGPFATAPFDAAPLTCLARGAQGCIAWMGLEGSEAQRLRDLGLREGACVGVVQNGASCIVALGSGCRLALRREVAAKLFVRPA